MHNNETNTNDNYADLGTAVNSIADTLKEEAAATDDPKAQAAWVNAEVGRAALELGVEVHERVLLEGVLKEALRVGMGVWEMEV